MKENIELEYKILVTKEQFDELLKNFPSLTFIEQSNTYYDTLDNQIQTRRGSMRIRKKGNCTFTLKMPSVHGLMEYECPVEDVSLASLQKEEIKQLLNKNGIVGELKELTTLVTQRAIYETEYAELCFDISTYNGITDYELEYEYKKEHDGLKVFNEILSKAGLVYSRNCTSKCRRALRSL